MTLDAHELVDWMAYDRIEPFGDERADLRAGQIAATVANVHAAKGKRFQPSDFMPFLPRPSVDDQVRATMTKIGAKRG